MRNFITYIDAVDPKTGILSTYMGPVIRDITIALAKKQVSEKYPYARVAGELKSEQVPWYNQDKDEIFYQNVEMN